MSCGTCPFAGTEESERAQNYACLPSAGEIMRINAETGKAWACHHDAERVCAGFVRECREAGVEYRGAPLTTYERWYRGMPL